jgi:uncharacterized protein YdiU (UPF0061 family)
MLMRIAESHIRFGHFEHFYYRRDMDNVRSWRTTIRHHWPHLQDEPNATRCGSRMWSRTAQMIARWQTVGFAHGVMNTDNMSILGLTMDYGPLVSLMTISRNISVITRIIRDATVLIISPR